MDYNSYNILNNDDKYEELGLHFEPINAPLCTPSLVNAHNPPVYIKPELPEVAQFQLNGDYSNSVICENYYNPPQPLDPTFVKDENLSDEMYFPHSTAKPNMAKFGEMVPFSSRNSDINFQLNEINSNVLGKVRTLEPVFIKNEHAQASDNLVKYEHDQTLLENVVPGNQGFVNTQEDTTELLDFDLNIVINNNYPFVLNSSTDSTLILQNVKTPISKSNKTNLLDINLLMSNVVPVALSRATNDITSQKQSMKRKRTVKEPKMWKEKVEKKDSTQKNTKKMKVSKTNDVVPVALISGKTRIRMFPEVFNVIDQPKKRGQPYKDDLILPNLGNETKKAETNVMSKPILPTMGENVLKYHEGGPVQLALRDDKNQLSQDLIIRPNISNSVAHNLSTSVRKYTRNVVCKPITLSKFDLPRPVPQGQTMRSLASINLPSSSSGIHRETINIRSEITTLQRNNLKGQEYDPAQIDSYLLNVPKVFVPKTPTVVSNIGPRKVFKIQTPIQELNANSNDNPQEKSSLRRRPRKVDPILPKSCYAIDPDDKVEKLVKSILSKHAKDLDDEKLGIKPIRFRKMDTNKSIPSKKVDPNKSKKIKTVKLDPVEEKFNLVQKPIKTYSRNKVSVQVATTPPITPENKTSTCIIGTKNNPITIVDENQNLFHKSIKTYTRNIPGLISKSTLVPAKKGFSKPPLVLQGNSKPPLVPQGISKPPLVPQGNSKSPLVPQGISKPPLVPQGISKSPLVPQGISKYYPNLTNPSIIAAAMHLPINKTTGKMPLVVLEKLKLRKRINSSTESSKTKTYSTLFEPNSRLSTFGIGSKLLTLLPETNQLPSTSNKFADELLKSSKLTRQLRERNQRRNFNMTLDKNLARILGTNKVPIVRLHRYIPPNLPKKGIAKSLGPSLVKPETLLCEPSIKVNLQHSIDSGYQNLNNILEENAISTSYVAKSQKLSTKYCLKKKSMTGKSKLKQAVKTRKNGLKESVIEKRAKKKKAQSLVNQVNPTSCHASTNTSIAKLLVDSSSSLVDQEISDKLLSQALVDALISEVLVEETISKVVEDTAVLVDDTFSKVVVDASVSEVLVDKPISESLINPQISELMLDPAMLESVNNSINDPSTFSGTAGDGKMFKTINPVFEPDVFHQILDTVKKAKAKAKRKQKYICEICKHKCVSKYRLKYHKKLAHDIGKMVLDRYKCPDCELSFSRKYDFDMHRSSSHIVKKFICKICKNQYARLELLKQHQKRHTLEYKFKCLFCGREFRDLTNRNRHMYSHTTTRPYKCDSCPKSFVTNLILVRHKRVHAVGGKVTRCRKCKEVFKEYHEFMHHLKVVHRSQEEYKCEICTLNFSTKALLTRHNIERHLDKSQVFSCDKCNQPYSSLRGLNRHQRIHEKKIPCTNCAKTFTFPNQLEKHFAQCHSNLRPFKCDLCDKAFSHRVFFNRHKQTHIRVMKTCPVCKKEVVRLDLHTRCVHANRDDLETIDFAALASKFPCFFCKSIYKTKQEMIEHNCVANPRRRTMLPQCLCLICKRTFHNEKLLEEHCIKFHRPLILVKTDKKFICTTCNQRFDTDEDRKEHSKIHLNPDGTRILPFSCEVCGQKFPSKRRKTLHTRVHDTSKSFPCPICFKPFRLKSYIKSHMRVHTGEKNYECEVCGRKFSDGNAKRKHLMIHTGERPFSCTICNKTFNRKSTVSLHMLSHTKESQHECQFCGKKYRYYCKFRLHLKQHFKPVDDEEIILGN